MIDLVMLKVLLEEVVRIEEVLRKKRLEK